MRKTITTALALFLLTNAYTQDFGDARLFSQTFYQGTAKSLGMGNAIGALGGDMTAVNINPAGLGIYRSDEFTATLNLMHNLNNSQYYGESHNANRFRMTLPNIGYVSAKQRSNYRSLRFTQFGVGLTRTHEFNIRTKASGINPTSSKIDNYLAQIDGYDPNELQDAFPFTVFPAWNTYLIDIYQDNLGDYYDSPVPQGGIRQGIETHFSGRSEEWNFTGSANYDDRIFIGGSVNLCHIKRQGSRLFEEQMPNNTVSETGFSQWSFLEDIASTGWGGNLKLGIIYHANHWLRLGAAFHSPTIFGFEETWQTETESVINSTTRKHISPESHYEYTFIKPLKWIGSAAFVIGQQGLVSIDAEYTNFGVARFSADDYDYSSTNDDIKATYGRTLNFRLGTEWRTNWGYLRAGTAFYGSPRGLANWDGSVQKASVGIGLPISESTTFDFAYELTHGMELHQLYNAGDLGIESITQRQFKTNLAATLRARF